MEILSNPSFIYCRLFQHAWKTLIECLDKTPESTPAEVVADVVAPIRSKLGTLLTDESVPLFLEMVACSLPIISTTAKETYGEDKEGIVPTLVDIFSKEVELKHFTDRELFSFDELVKSCPPEKKENMKIAWDCWLAQLVEDVVSRSVNDLEPEWSRFLLLCGEVYIIYAREGLLVSKKEREAKIISSSWMSTLGLLSEKGMDEYIALYEKTQGVVIEFLAKTKLTIEERELKVLQILSEQRKRLTAKKAPTPYELRNILIFFVNFLETNNFSYVESQREIQLRDSMEALLPDLQKAMKIEELKETCLELQMMLLLKCSNEYLVNNIEEFIQKTILKQIWTPKYSLLCLRCLLSLLRGRIISRDEDTDIVSDPDSYTLVLRESSGETIMNCMKIIFEEFLTRKKRDLKPIRIHFTYIWKIIAQMAAFNTEYVVKTVYPKVMSVALGDPLFTGAALRSLHVMLNRSSGFYDAVLKSVHGMNFPDEFKELHADLPKDGVLLASFTEALKYSSVGICAGSPASLVNELRIAPGAREISKATDLFSGVECYEECLECAKILFPESLVCYSEEENSGFVGWGIIHEKDAVAAAARDILKIVIHGAASGDEKLLVSWVKIVEGFQGVIMHSLASGSHVVSTLIVTVLKLLECDIGEAMSKINLKLIPIALAGLCSLESLQKQYALALLRRAGLCDFLDEKGAEIVQSALIRYCMDVNNFSSQSSVQEYLSGFSSFELDAIVREENIIWTFVVEELSLHLVEAGFTEAAIEYHEVVSGWLSSLQQALIDKDIEKMDLSTFLFPQSASNVRIGVSRVFFRLNLLVSYAALTGRSRHLSDLEETKNQKIEKMFERTSSTIRDRFLPLLLSKNGLPRFFGAIATGALHGSGSILAIEELEKWLKSSSGKKLKLAALPHVLSILRRVIEKDIASFVLLLKERDYVLDFANFFRKTAEDYLLQSKVSLNVGFDVSLLRMNFFAFVALLSVAMAEQPKDREQVCKIFRPVSGKVWEEENRKKTLGLVLSWTGVGSNAASIYKLERESSKIALKKGNEGKEQQLMQLHEAVHFWALAATESLLALGPTFNEDGGVAEDDFIQNLLEMEKRSDGRRVLRYVLSFQFEEFLPVIVSKLARAVSPQDRSLLFRCITDQFILPEASVVDTLPLYAVEEAPKFEKPKPSVADDEEEEDNEDLAFVELVREAKGEIIFFSLLQLVTSCEETRKRAFFVLRKALGVLPIGTEKVNSCLAELDKIRTAVESTSLSVARDAVSVYMKVLSSHARSITEALFEQLFVHFEEFSRLYRHTSAFIILPFCRNFVLSEEEDGDSVKLEFFKIEEFLDALMEYTMQLGDDSVVRDTYVIEMWKEIACDDDQGKQQSNLEHILDYMLFRADQSSLKREISTTIVCALHQMLPERTARHLVRILEKEKIVVKFQSAKHQLERKGTMSNLDTFFVSRPSVMDLKKLIDGAEKKSQEESQANESRKTETEIKEEMKAMIETAEISYDEEEEERNFEQQKAFEVAEGVVDKQSSACYFIVRTLEVDSSGLIGYLPKLVSYGLVHMGGDTGTATERARDLLRLVLSVKADHYSQEPLQGQYRRAVDGLENGAILHRGSQTGNTGVPSFDELVGTILSAFGKEDRHAILSVIAVWTSDISLRTLAQSHRAFRAVLPHCEAEKTFLAAVLESMVGTIFKWRGEISIEALREQIATLKSLAISSKPAEERDRMDDAIFWLALGFMECYDEKIFSLGFDMLLFLLKSEKLRDFFSSNKFAASVKENVGRNIFLGERLLYLLRNVDSEKDGLRLLFQILLTKLPVDLISTHPPQAFIVAYLLSIFGWVHVYGTGQNESDFGELIAELAAKDAQYGSYARAVAEGKEKRRYGIGELGIYFAEISPAVEAYFANEYFANLVKELTIHFVTFGNVAVQSAALSFLAFNLARFQNVELFQQIIEHAIALLEKVDLESSLSESVEILVRKYLEIKKIDGSAGSGDAPKLEREMLEIDYSEKTKGLFAMHLSKYDKYEKEGRMNERFRNFIRSILLE